MIYERLLFLGVKLHTIAEGEIGRLHVGLKGTMNAEQLAAIARKIRDALAKRFRDGQNPGGICYGYALDFVADARGDRIPGHRKIVTAQAETVVHIHEHYAAGRSGQDLTIELNAKGVPGPRGGRWSASTINGNASRGTGILNNQLYAGRPEHLRQTFRKDPESGARRAFRNADDLCQTALVPHLRIASDDLGPGQGASGFGRPQPPGRGYRCLCTVLEQAAPEIPVEWQAQVRRVRRRLQQERQAPRRLPRRDQAWADSLLQPADRPRRRTGNAGIG